LNISSSQNENRFKLTRATLLRNVAIVVFFWFILGIPTVVIWFETIAFLQAKNPDPFIFFIARLMLFVVILMSFTFLFVNLTFILDFFSFIRITPDGIEQRRSPFRQVKSTWSDVEKFGKFQLVQDVVFIKSHLRNRKLAEISTPLNLLIPKQSFILLTGYEGWSEGGLKDDLKKYAPWLFENQSIPQEIKTEKIDVPTTSANQDYRLLAVLSHVSVLFSVTGVIVPIGIYALQKNKSSYIEFQALQATIWQVAAFMFNAVASSCMVGSIFIPALITNISESNFAGGIFFMVIASVSIMTIGNMAFIIYGIVGAIMTYQGKDFRYVLLAIVLKKAKVLNQQTAPNKACSGRVGFCRIFKHFSGFGFFLLPNLIHARPHATNANR